MREPRTLCSIAGVGGAGAVGGTGGAAGGIAGEGGGAVGGAAAAGGTGAGAATALIDAAIRAQQELSVPQQATVLLPFQQKSSDATLVINVRPPAPPPPPIPISSGDLFSPAPNTTPNFSGYGGEPVSAPPPPLLPRSTQAPPFGRVMSGLDDFVGQFRGVPLPVQAAIVGAGTAIALGQPELAPGAAKLGAQLGEVADLSGKFFRRLSDATVRALTSPQTGAPRELAPLINPQDCPSCSGDRLLQLQEAERQLDDLRHEIEVEQQQQHGEQLQQQQRELDELRQLERQPPGTRDIPRELQQKQQLLNQLQQEIAQLRQPGQQFPRESVPPPPGEVPLIESPQGHLVLEPDTGAPPSGPPLMFQGEPPPEMPTSDGHVKFCVACTTQNEALKFLNGEPAQCSVMPS